MKVVKGFTRARELLSRQVSAQTLPLSPALRRRLNKLFGTEDPEQAVRWIIDRVCQEGDAALFSLAEKIDGVKLSSLELSQKQVQSAYQKADEELIAVIKQAAERIREFHTAQKKAVCHELAGKEWGQLIRPLEKVGIYVPGGTAAYPSTVLMTAVPAKSAGVKEVVMVTPPKADGEISPAVLVAADVAGVDRIFTIGGAQAIAALAYGTESVPRVDKICGPGNVFVVLAKKAVYGDVGIDGLQGPSEVLLIADETASAEYCAADLLAQAEHDPLAQAILVTTSLTLAEKVNKEIARQLARLSRKATAGESLKRGVIAVVESMDEAVALANFYAPEHLCLMVRDTEKYINRIANAGCIIIGDKATVVLGDYIAGPSHVLPTGGTARFSSPLSVIDFVKFINVIKVSDAMLRQVGPAASLLARAEGLDAHAMAIEKRLKAG